MGGVKGLLPACLLDYQCTKSRVLVQTITQRDADLPPDLSGTFDKTNQTVTISGTPQDPPSSRKLRQAFYFFSCTWYISKKQMADIIKVGDVKLQISKELIEPMYISDVKTAIREKKCWRVTGQIFETMSKALVAVGCIISFSSGYYNNPELGFVAGAVSTVSLALLQFASFSYGQNKKNGSELNLLLNKLNIDSVPEMNRDGSKNDDSQKDTSGNEDVYRKEIPTPHGGGGAVRAGVGSCCVGFDGTTTSLTAGLPKG